MASDVRVLKISSAIFKAISDIFYCELGKSIPISEVIVSKDLRNADIFIYNDKGINIKELTDDVAFFRHKLAKNLALRYVPQLKFHMMEFDSSYEYSLLANEKD